MRRASCALVLLASALPRAEGWQDHRPTSFRTPSRLHSQPVTASAQAAPRDAATAAVASLAATTLALLAGDEAEAKALAGSAAQKRENINLAFSAYDHCSSGTLSYDEANALFTQLARSIVEELATSDATRGVAQSNARRILDDDDKRGTINRVASKLLMLADVDGDGRINLSELAALFDVVQSSSRAQTAATFPTPLSALAGSLQLLPPSVGAAPSRCQVRLWRRGASRSLPRLARACSPLT